MRIGQRIDHSDIVKRAEEHLEGERLWDEHYERMQAEGYISSTSMLVADDEMARAGWVRLPDGWKRV